ncbi:MAG: S46 family peptidase, partial [Pirellulales bacterium]
MVSYRLPSFRCWLVISQVLLLLIGCLTAGPAWADEGMWLFNDLPSERLKQTHGFTPPAGWLERLQQAAVRFNSGGSGAFVSADGLVLTNHHVAASSLQKLSSPERNLAQDGFLARTRAEEIPCVDLELNVLVSIEDVTAAVQAAVADEADAVAAANARREVLAGIEKQSLETTGLRSDVVTLFGGGRFQLYRFRRYTD